MSRPPDAAAPLVAAIALLSVLGCGDGGGAADQAPVAVLAAFPAELVAVLDRTSVDETRTIDGRVFRMGRIGRRPVVVGMTGVGLNNARDTTRIMLDSFAVSGVVVSAVAGSPLMVGDVTVPATWILDDGSRYASDAAWLEQAAEVVAAGRISLDGCAIIPEIAQIPGASAGDLVCFPYAPRVVVGGFGSSSDPYGGRTFQCVPGGNDVFACDDDQLSAVGVSAGGTAPAELVRLDAEKQAAYDMETAAIAREAAARGLPFIAFRASSDGGDDPLDVDGFIEFFAYYRMAAHNAAVAAAAFLDRDG